MFQHTAINHTEENIKHTGWKAGLWWVTESIRTLRWSICPQKNQKPLWLTSIYSNHSLESPQIWTQPTALHIAKRVRKPPAKVCAWLAHLSLYEHGHVHEHLMQLPDAGLQLHDVLVAGLDLVQGLPGDLGVWDDLRTDTHLSAALWESGSTQHTQEYSHQRWRWKDCRSPASLPAPRLWWSSQLEFKHQHFT